MNDRQNLFDPKTAFMSNTSFNRYITKFLRFDKIYYSIIKLICNPQKIILKTTVYIKK